MDNTSFEFDIKLKKVSHPSRIKSDQKFLKIPNIRKHLLLAYQIDRLIEDRHDLSLHKISSWLGITYPRVKQIVDLLFLCPMIQEEIILNDSNKISCVTEYALRPIVKEIDWQKQLSLWQSLPK